MKEYNDIELEINENEKKILLGYYKDSKRKAKKIKRTGNFQSLKENDIDTICTIEMFRQISSLLDKARNQFKEDFSEEIENKFLTEIFITIATYEYESNKKKKNEKDSFINEYVQKLYKWFEFFISIYTRLNSLYIEFDLKKRSSTLKKRIDEFFNEFYKNFSSIERREKNFLFSLIEVEVINSIKKRNGLDNEKLEAFSSLVDAVFTNRIMSVPPQ